MALEKKKLKNNTITEHCCCITFKVVPKTICIHAKKLVFSKTKAVTCVLILLMTFIRYKTNRIHFFKIQTVAYSKSKTYFL